MEEAMTRRGIPAFGGWNHCEDLPANHYFWPASQAGLPRGGAGLAGGYVGGGGGHLYPPHLSHYYYQGQDTGKDLFQVPAPHSVVATAYPRKVRKGTAVEKQLKRQKQKQQQQHKGERTPEQPQQKQNKQGKVCDCDATTHQPQRRPVMAVDEDLYKIPPKLLYQKSRRKNKKVIKDFWSSCLGLNCVP